MQYIWKRFDRNIELHAEDDSFHISYNPSTDKGAETAIVLHHSNYPNPYYILLGDWRKQYEPLVDKGLDACLQFFANHRECKSSWSNDLPENFLAAPVLEDK